MNRAARLALAALSIGGGVLASLASAPARADVADKAYSIFQARDYATVFDQLYDYRTRNVGTLRVDFMLGVSACHMNSVEHRALGGYLLAIIPDRYGPLSTVNGQAIRIQSAACPRTRMSESEAIAGISAKGDGMGLPLDRRVSKSGSGDALPAAPPAPPPPSMSPLRLRQAYKAGHDYKSVPTVSAYACQVLCAGDKRCKAVTWIDSQKLCWLKDALSPLAANSDMTSSQKQVP